MQYWKKPRNYITLCSFQPSFPTKKNNIKTDNSHSGNKKVPWCGFIYVSVTFRGQQMRKLLARLSADDDQLWQPQLTAEKHLKLCHTNRLWVILGMHQFRFGDEAYEQSQLAFWFWNWLSNQVQKSFEVAPRYHMILFIIHCDICISIYLFMYL